MLDRALVYMETGQVKGQHNFVADMEFYLLAVYLDIPVLQAFMIHRCQTYYFVDAKNANAVMGVVKTDQTPAPIDTFRKVFLQTAACDGIRLVLMRSVLKWYNHLTVRRHEFVTLFQVEEPDVWRVLCGMQKELNSK